MTVHRLKLVQPTGPLLIKLPWHYPVDDNGVPRLPSDGARVSEMYDPVRNLMRSVAKGELPWPMMFSGCAGCGKTMASRVLMHYCSGAMMWTLAKWHQITYAKDGGDVWDMFKRPSLVVLDDVGDKPTPTEGESMTLKRCLDVRERLPLVVITNRSPEWLGKWYGDPIADRMISGTRITSDQFGTKSRRGEL